MTLAVAVLQVAWMFSVRPFGQMDEVDHVYRATSVAQGHLIEGTSNAAAYGELIPVPSTIVAAAHHRCAQLPYMKSANCSATTPADASGDVLVASAAARYNPVYYALVGWPTQLVHASGFGALEMMRAITALLFDAIFLVAAWTTIAFARQSANLLGFFIVVMPVAICASVSVAPNGLQMAAGLGMWSALCPLIARPDLDARSQRRLLYLAGVMAGIVLLTHTTGPVWVLLTAVAFVAALGRRRLIELWRSTRAAFATSVGLAMATGVGVAAWTLLRHTNAVGGARKFGTPGIAEVLGQPIAWWFQAVGAVPFRDNPAPIWVYALAMAGFGVVVTIAFLHARRRIRWTLVAISASVLAVSLALNTSAYPYIGNAWQGRYTLALAYGIPLLGSASIGISRKRLPVWALPAIAAVTAVVNAAVLINVRVSIEGPKWSAADGVRPLPVALVVTLGAASAVLLVLAAIRLNRYFVAATQRSSAAAADPSSIAADARFMPATSRSSTEPAPAS